MLNKLKFEVFGVKREHDIHSEPGDNMKQTYRMKIDEKGREVLVPDDYYDMQEEIDSYEESVNVNNIIERYMAGDESALNRAQAFFADVSKVPKNFAQILDLNNRAKQEFYNLPVEVQELFDNDYMDFLNNPQRLDEYIANNDIKKMPEKVVEDVQDEKSAD